jgi:ABC-2 type transport system permease protein
MSTSSISLQARKLSVARVLNIYWKETKYEFLKRWRMPIYSLSVLLFPAMFYTLFGLILNRDANGHANAARYLMATMGCYGVLGVSLFAFGVGIAVERGQGWLEVKRASPMPAAAHFVGRIGTCLLFSLLVFLSLFFLGTTFGGVRLESTQIVSLMLTQVIGSIPFCALGLLIGYLAKPNSAPSIVNMIYLPLSFLSGLWMPIQILPEFLQKAAALLPTYHFGQLALHAVAERSNGAPQTHIGVLIGFTLVCAGLSLVVVRREEGKLYG